MLAIRLTIEHRADDIRPQPLHPSQHDVVWRHREEHQARDGEEDEEHEHLGERVLGAREDVRPEGHHADRDLDRLLDDPREEPYAAFLSEYWTRSGFPVWKMIIYFFYLLVECRSTEIRRRWSLASLPG